MSGVINPKHFQNLQQKDQIIKHLMGENQKLQHALHGRNVFDSFLGHALNGCLSNPDFTKEGTTPAEKAQVVTTMALIATNTMMDLLNRVAEEQQKKHDEAQAAADKQAETPAEAATEAPVEAPVEPA